MKKIFSLVFFISLLVFASCTGKKDRLVADTLTVAIDPKTVSVYAGETKILKAVVKDARSNDLGAAAEWTLEPAGLGTLSAASGKEVLFTPSAAGASGKIYAKYSSITTVADVSVKYPGAGTLKYALLTDTQAAAGLTRDGANAVIFNYFDTDGVVPWQAASSDVYPGCAEDPVKCTKLEYTYTTGATAGAGWGGLYVEYTAAKSLAAYTSLTFYVKGSVGGEKFKVGMSDGTDVKLNVSGVTTSWQKITLPLANFPGLNTAAITKPFIVAFEDVYTGSSITVYLDCIGFE